MRTVLLSLLMGTLVGVAYGVCNIRSPAPPVIALLGLLGMVLGEQMTTIVKHRWPVPQSANIQDGTTPHLDR